MGLKKVIIMMVAVLCLATKRAQMRLAVWLNCPACIILKASALDCSRDVGDAIERAKLGFRPSAS